MDKKEYYRKLLEAKLRGMLVGTADTSNNLTEKERKVFFDDAVRRGLFLKESSGNTKYGSFDEMLNDFKKGKKIICIGSPHHGPGYFNLPDNHKKHYEEFNQVNANALNPTELNFRTSFRSSASEIIRDHSAEPGDAPAVPGGFMSKAWNGIVKLFTGHSSEAWAEYDEYQEKRTFRNAIDKATNEYLDKYDAEPCSARDDFTKELLDTDREGRIARGEQVAQNSFIETKNAADRVKQSDEEQIAERIKAQQYQDQLNYNRKSEQLKEIDYDIYRNFFGYDDKPRQYKSLDEALAAAMKIQEEAHKTELNAKALGEIQKAQTAIVGSMSLELWKRDDATEEIIKNNAYNIRKYLDANRNNLEFRQKVAEETEQLKKRCEEVGMPIFYTRHQALHDMDIEMMVAVREIGAEGADKYKLIVDVEIEEQKILNAKHVYEAPVIDDSLAEKHLSEGTATEEEIDRLLEIEDKIRSEIIKSAAGNPADISRLNPSLDFDYDIERSGMGSDSIGNKVLTLKMMRAQHNAIMSGAPLPFVFGTDAEIKVSVEQAEELGFIPKPEVPGYKQEDEPTEEQGEPVSARIAEELDEAEAEYERNLSNKAEFLDKCRSGENLGVVETEYTRLLKLIEDSKDGDDPVMQSVAEKAEAALDRIVDAKFGFEQYDSDDAVHDIACIVALTGCARDPGFKEQFASNEQNAYSRLTEDIRSRELHLGLLETPAQVDKIFFRDNNLEGDEANLDTYGLLLNARKAAIELAEKNRQESIEKTLSQYSESQLRIINSPEAIISIQQKMNSVEDIDGEMTKEETLLKNNARQAMASVYSEVLMKPQGEELDASQLMNDLTDIAIYQSLQNPEYRKACLNLIGASKIKDADPKLTENFSVKYRDMIRAQIDVSGFIQQIHDDRTAIAKLVFSDNGSFFSKLEKTNMQKGVTFGTVADNELQHISGVDKALRAEIQKYSAGHSKDETAKMFEKSTKDLKLDSDIMNDVCARLKNGAKLSKEAMAAEAEKEKSMGNVLGK